MSTRQLLVGAWALLALTFLGFYFVARRMNNFGIVDIVWSYSFGIVALIYAWLGRGWLERRIALAVMAVIWSSRLGTHLFHRVMSHHPEEDRRYHQLRQEWKKNFAVKMAGFFQMQALSVLGISVPYLLICRHGTLGFSSLEWVAFGVWLVAIVGETVSDRQLAQFSRTHRKSKEVCDVGLWHYSRHPNYFFEWLNWVSYGVLACAAPHGWWGLIGPASILWLLLRVTGIPMTEQQSLRSRGDAYRRYQRRTSAFIPWFSKQRSHD